MDQFLPRPSRSSLLRAPHICSVVSSAPAPSEHEFAYAAYQRLDVAPDETGSFSATFLHAKLVGPVGVNKVIIPLERVRAPEEMFRDMLHEDQFHPIMRLRQQCAGPVRAAMAEHRFDRGMLIAFEVFPFTKLIGVSGGEPVDEGVAEAHFRQRHRVAGRHSFHTMVL